MKNSSSETGKNHRRGKIGEQKKGNALATKKIKTHIRGSSRGKKWDHAQRGLRRGKRWLSGSQLWHARSAQIWGGGKKPIAAKKKSVFKGSTLDCRGGDMGALLHGEIGTGDKPKF